MDKSILLQKQVRDNSEDLRNYLNDLVSWEDDMKRKEAEISQENTTNTIPTIRKKIKTKNSEKEESKQRIKGYDYAAWDKFDVDAECEKVEKDPEPKSESSDSEDPSTEYQTRLRDEANYEKERGNQFVKQKKWDEAIACYTHAIACFSKDPIYYANRALCFLKKNDLHSAEADCTSALQLNATYVKALQRRAAAREGLKQLSDAVEDLRKVLEIEPHNVESKKELQKIESRLGVQKIATTTKTVAPVKPSTSKENQQGTSKAQSQTNESLQLQNKKEDLLIERPSTSAITKEPDKQKNIRIPWPKRLSSEIILPVNKLPHQRSKKPLRRINVEASDSNEININNIKEQKNTIKSTDVDYNESNALAKILAQTKQLDIDEFLQDIGKNASTKTIDKNTENTDKYFDKSKVEISTNNKVFNFSVPKSSVQFYSNWKTMKNNNEQKYRYLKSIPPEELPNIFQDSLESDIFSDMIDIFNEYFIRDKLSIYLYIKSLACVKRFAALTMFMSTKDKLALKNIFAYCENKESSADEMNVLKKKYEL